MTNNQDPINWSYIARKLRHDRSWQWGAAAVVGVLVLIVAFRALTPPLRAPGETRQLLLFYQRSSEKQTALLNISQNARQVTYLAPFWYAICADGTVEDHSEEDVKRFAHASNIRLQPLVHNLSSKAMGTHLFLRSPEARARVIKQLAGIVDAEGYAGLSVDLQLLPNELRDGFQSFMAGLYAELQKRDKLLTVNVIPHGSTQQAEKGSYDIMSLSRVTDAVVLMAYDYSGHYTAPGPVAPLEWVREVVEFAVRETDDPRGIILGLPAYGYRWRVDSAERATTMPLHEIEKLLDKRGIEPERDDEGSSPHFKYTEGGVEYIVWYEDAQSIRPKLQLARDKNLHGVAVWRAGYVTPEYWRSLSQGLH